MSNAIASLWAIAKELKIPLDAKVKELQDIPYTISYVVRKRMQVDNLNELPKEKRPPEDMIWDGNSKDVENWLDKVFRGKSEPKTNIVIKDDELED